MTAAQTTYCPHCRIVTNLSVFTAPLIVADPDGSHKVTTTKTYHCEVCGLFVRSEEDPGR